MKFFLKIFLALLILSPAARAATLSEYRENISHLKDDLRSLLVPGDDWTEERKKTFIAEVSEELPQLFPPKEKIEWRNETIETDNEWLVNKFSSFKALEENSPERKRILAEMYERLDAVEKKIVELETVAASERTKDAEKQKLAEILKREEYARPPDEQEESVVARTYRRLREWVKGLFPEPEISPRPTADGFPAIPFLLQILIYALVFGLIGFLFYKFAPYLIARLGKRERRDKRERVILGETIAADATPDNLFGDAERMAREGDLRGAIRKGYIALLCELSDRKIIGLSKNKTNRDYLRDVRRRGELYQNMNGLTNNYEKHWYGSQEAGESDWDEFRDGYRKAVKGN